ncbi:T9SS type A sorting domain-containing protein [Epilithonimonas sp. JDS]|uniref:T9SS type A sorting domain-containing protein n=1 Tax=Epilithonimonas sp. JDS TaxID=2902797 RepID=UPI001E475906|nr:T9SS type A sorting domain-containing protein [Epilithonimonas sp. JDS]MCD9853848.1 T9SS type A sorting domain-containing protein [Epilithonimonas sp. JDS]
MKKLYISLGILILSYSYAQKVSWQKNVEYGAQDFLSGLAVTVDGQFLVSGSSIQKNQNPTAGSNQNKGYDYHILKLDQQGQKVWEKYFSGNQHDYLSSTVSTQEGGFLLAGTSYSSLAIDKKDKSSGSSDMWIIKVDENGEEEWQKTIGTRYSEEARSVTQTMDKGFVVVGSTNHPKLGYGSKDVMVVKLDKTGKILNQLILGGKGLDEVEKVIPTNDGGVLMGIYSRSGVSEGQAKSKINSKDLLSQNTGTTNNNSSSNSNSQSSSSANNSNSNSNNQSATESYDINFYGKAYGNYGEGDYWIVKLDKNGAVQWEKNFGGSEDDHIRTMALTETGYIIGGESRSQTSGNKSAKLEKGTDLWLLSLDQDGNEEWQKSYNFKNRDVLMSLNAIRNSDSETKGFLIGGYTQSEGKVQENDETFWMLYIDKNGKEVWRKYVEGKEKKNEERLVSAILNRDGSYVLAGTSAEELGKENWKIVKLLDSDVENLIENKDIQIYPNPVRDYCYVEIGLDFDQADIYLYDMTGKIIQKLQTKNKVTKINTGRLPQGIYIIKANIPNQQDKNLSTKIVKE